jgi:hypothetical protein
MIRIPSFRFAAGARRGLKRIRPRSDETTAKLRFTAEVRRGLKPKHNLTVTLKDDLIIVASLTKRGED